MAKKAKRPGGQPGRQTKENQKHQTCPKYNTKTPDVGVGWVEPFDDFTDFIVNDMRLPVADILPNWRPGDAVSVIAYKTQIAGYPTQIFRFCRVGAGVARQALRSGAHLETARPNDFPNIIMVGWMPESGVGMVNAIMPDGGGAVVEMIDFAEYAPIALAAARKWAGGGVS